MTADAATRWHPTALRIFTDREPAEITRLLGLEPTRVAAARGGARRKWAWSWNTGVDDTAPFDDHAAAFIAHLRPLAARIRELTSDSVVELRTGYAAALGQGGITLSPDLVALLAAMGAAVNLDLYPPGPTFDLDADHAVDPLDEGPAGRV